MNDALCVILAGGLGTRMGGGDKPLKTVGGISILQRVITRLQPQCAGVVINANGAPERLSAFGLPVIADTITGYAGPLAGVLAGMEHCAANCPNITLILSAAADCPFLPGDLCRRLGQARDAAGADIAVAASGGWRHPTIALWPVALAAALAAALERGERKIDRWTADYETVAVEWAIEGFDPFFNANAPEDIQEAERLISLHRQA